MFYAYGTYITLNSVSGNGSEQTCTAGQSRDGAGGGIVSAPGSSPLSAVLNTNSNASISANTARAGGAGRAGWREGARGHSFVDVRDVDGWHHVVKELGERF
jgi:hypothetical protein